VQYSHPEHITSLATVVSVPEFVFFGTVRTVLSLDLVELNYIVQNGQVGSGESYGRRNDQNPETGAVENVLLVVAPSL
jgi:hypothetical protein